MENNKQIRPLTPREKDFATENYHLIMRFLKLSKLDAEDFFDVVVFDYLLSVEKYLNDAELREKCNFEAVSYVYMRRAVYGYFRREKAMRRSSDVGDDISYEVLDSNIGKVVTMENFSALEYTETIKQIESHLTREQWKIFSDKLEGYSLKEIAENNGFNPNRVYRQFGKIKGIVAEIMEIKG